MANIYKNAKLNLTNTNVTTLYTAPTGNTSIIKSIIVNERTNSASTLSVILFDKDPAASGNPFNLYTTKAITALQTLELLDKPLVIKSGEVIQVTAGHANRLMVTASLLEIS